MANEKFTQKSVEKLKPATNQRRQQIVVWDGALKGFGVRITKRGRKSWVAYYRVNGKAVWETFGTTDLLTLKQATELAQASMRLARTGVNPVEQKRAQQQATDQLTFGSVVEDYLKVKERGLRASTLKETKRMLNRALKVWADKPVAQISRSDVTKFLDGIADKRLHKMNGHEGQPLAETRSVLICLGTFFGWAEKGDKISTNPMLKISKGDYGKGTPRDRVLEDDEIKRVWDALEGLGWPFQDIGRLILLTGQRPGEVAGMRWSEIIEDKAEWTLPAARTKNNKAHMVHLSDQAMYIIQNLPHEANVANLVFPNGKGQPAGSFDKAKVKLDAILGDIPHWTWHDLRRTAATKMAELGIGEHVVDKILNHQKGVISGVAAIYNRHAYTDERRAALELLGSHIESLVFPALPQLG